MHYWLVECYRVWLDYDDDTIVDSRSNRSYISELESCV